MVGDDDAWRVDIERLENVSCGGTSDAMVDRCTGGSRGYVSALTGPR